MSNEMPQGDPNAEDEDAGLLDLALVLAENIKLLIAIPLITMVCAVAITFVMPPTFTATTRLLVPQQQQNSTAALTAQLGALAGLVGGAAGIKNPADQYVALLKSRTVSDALIARFNLKVLYDARYAEDARKILASKSRIRAGTKDGVIAVDVDDHDAKRAADMANAFVEELSKLTNTLAVTEAGQRRLFFDTQLKQARDNLTKSELALRGSGVSEATLKTVPQAQLEPLARLKALITAQEIKLASMRSYMTESNPELRVGIQELLALRAELAKAEQSNAANAGGEGTEYIAKYRDFKYHEALFEVMAKQYALAQLDEAREGAVIQVIDRAQPPERHSKPQRALIAALTGIAFFLLTLVLIFVRRSLRNSANQPALAQKLARLRELVRFRRAA